jgi:hypothetical protein
MVNGKAVHELTSFYYSLFTIYHLLVLGHHFFSTLKDLAQHALLWH